MKAATSILHGERLLLLPIGQGVIATVLAVVIVAAWLALGSTFLGPAVEDDPLAAPLSLLIGSGLTSFVLAVFAVAGHVTAGVVLCAVIGTIALVARGSRTAAIASVALRSLGKVAQGTATRLSITVIGLLAWVSAVSPPRSADAMRYHLAHIRQIVGEGRWVSIADYHYALPFGWSLSYLPFEMLGLPQGSQVLGALLLLIVIASAAAILRSRGVSAPALFGALLLLLHPAVLRAFTEAGVDGYSLLAMLVIAGLLMRLPEMTTREALLLGFASWIGIQSRYQLVAAGIACGLVVVVALRNIQGRVVFLRNFIIGAVAALVLASPFYVANALAFRNPVWPLMIPESALARKNYADVVAYYYSKSLTGEYSPQEILTALWTLLSTPFVFPLSSLVIAFVSVGVVSRRTEEKNVGLFGAAFFALWLAMAPLLYPRFVLMLVPGAVLGAGFALTRWLDGSSARLRRWTTAFSIGAAALAVASVFASGDNIRYAMTGDSQEYHRFTWYYPVYQWVNRSTPVDSRFLVAVSSGMTYYLDRPYRRADPWISGVVDWEATSTGRALDELMTRGGYSYLLYEDADWNSFRGGREMHTAVKEAIAQGTLVPVRKFNERLYTSRFWRKYRETTVYVMKHVTRDQRLSRVLP